MGNCVSGSKKSSIQEKYSIHVVDFWWGRTTEDNFFESMYGGKYGFYLPRYGNNMLCLKLWKVCKDDSCDISLDGNICPFFLPFYFSIFSGYTSSMKMKK